MAFSSNTSSSSADINVTPLIDVLLVLLIIFMVLVPVVPRGLNSAVPQDHAATSAAIQQPSTIRVIEAAGQPPRYQFDGRDTSFMERRSALEHGFAARQDHTLFVQAERTISYGEVAAVLGEASAAGAAPVALLKF